MQTPLVSIIIPTFNRAHLISETLDSVLAQTYANWECIVVDDGSTDNTNELLKEYCKRDARFQYFIRPNNRMKGPSSCRNYGFNRVKGDWIHFLDSDDTYMPNVLEHIVKFSLLNYNAIVVKHQWIDSATKNKIGENRIESDHLLVDYFCGKVSYYVSGPFWGREFLNIQIELFDDKIRYLDDWDFNLRMLYQNPKIKILNKKLINYNLSKSSLSHQILDLKDSEIKSEIIAREKHLKIIARNNEIDLKLIRVFVRDGYKGLLRKCLVNNNKCSFLLFKKMTRLNIKLLDFKCLAFSILGFGAYKVFDKGDKFFK